MLLHRYHNIDYINNLDVNTGISLIIHAMKERRDNRLWLQWAIQLPLMNTADNFIPFEDYRDRATGANIDTRPVDEILAELDVLEKEMEEVST